MNQDDTKLHWSRWESLFSVGVAYSERLGHYYLGVEHLFMAMTKLDQSLTQKALAAFGLDPKETRDRLKLDAGPGYEKPPWEGFVPTPRLLRTLNAAHELAQDEDHQRIGERHLLLAILEDDDSLLARTLQRLGQELQRDLSQLCKRPERPPGRRRRKARRPTACKFAPTMPPLRSNRQPSSVKISRRCYRLAPRLC